MTYIPTVVCVPCAKEMVPVKNGVILRANTSKPYYIVAGDKYECPQCAAAVVTGFSRKPIALQHEDGFLGRRYDLDFWLR